MREDLTEKLITEISPTPKRDYGITALKQTTKKPSWFIKPWWLFVPGTLSHAACPDEDTALEIYTQFFLFNNPQCQKALFGSLMQDIIHAETAIFNIYDDSKASVEFAVATVDGIVNRWKEKISGLIGTNFLHQFGFFIDTPAVYQHRDPVNTYDASSVMKALCNGAAPYDFLANHPETQNQFNRHLLGLSYHALNNKLQVAKVVTDSIQNKS